MRLFLRLQNPEKHEGYPYYIVSILGPVRLYKGWDLLYPFFVSLLYRFQLLQSRAHILWPF
jgi:hypothetical protein